MARMRRSQAGRVVDRHWCGGEVCGVRVGVAGSRRRLGDLPPLGEWVRLEVPVAQVALKPGAVIDGWAFTQFGGTVQWDTAGIVTTSHTGPRLFASLAAWSAQLAKSGKSGKSGSESGSGSD